METSSDSDLSDPSSFEMDSNEETQSCTSGDLLPVSGTESNVGKPKFEKDDSEKNSEAFSMSAFSSCYNIIGVY